jgi:Uma2 family endonuclease
MTMRQSQRHYPIGEYFLAELMSSVRHEYFDGEIFVMSGGSRNHDTITVNVTGLFHAALRGSSCQAFSGSMRVRTPSGLYTYPDASIVCGAPDITRVEGTDTVGNPVVLVEVLSPSTGDYDRGQKFELYRSIATLRDYVLIEQSRVAVEHWSIAGSGEWTSRTTSGIDEHVRLTGVDVELPLSLVSERVTF